MAGLIHTANADGSVATPVSAANPAPVSLGGLPADRWSYAAAASGIVNTTTAVTIKAAAGAGVRNFITGLQLSAEAVATATEFAIRDGAGGAVLWRTKIGTGGLTAGREIVFPSPLVGTANTLLEVVTLTATVTGAVYVNVQGYTA
jgi:hypothetical protein